MHRHIYAHASGSQVRDVTYTSGIGEADPAGLRGEIVPADTQQRADTGNCTLSLQQEHPSHRRRNRGPWGGHGLSSNNIWTPARIRLSLFYYEVS